MPNLVPQLIFSAVTAAVLVGWMTRRADDPREVASWCQAYRVGLTTENRAMIVWFVRLTITVRVIGAVAGIVLGSLFDRAFLLRTSTDEGFWVWVIAGWVLGGTWAGTRLTSKHPGGAASLTPRRVSDYLPGVVRWGPIIAAAVVTVTAIVGLAMGRPEHPSDLGGATPLDLVLLATGAWLAAGLALWGEHAVVARRQPAAHADVMAADDACRSATVHLIAAGITAAIFLLGLHASTGILMPRQAPFGLRLWIPLAYLIAAVLAGRYFVYRAWRVRRTPAPARTQALAS